MEISYVMSILTDTRSAILATLIILLPACSTTSPLHQQWTLSVGQETFPVQISQLNFNEVMLTSTLEEISGIYFFQEEKLILKKAKQPRISDITFEKNTVGSWVVTSAPTAARLPIPIFGATLEKN